MSKRYPGGLITKNPNINPTPEGGASGIWTLDQAILYQQLGTWPSVTDPYFNQTTLLLHGDGTNGAQNNTFLDSSTNNFTVTRNGNTTQGSFSPFSVADGEWSNYFDGTGDSLSIANASALDLDADFTIEAWIYPTSLPNTFQTIVITCDNSTSAGGIGIWARSNAEIQVGDFVTTTAILTTSGFNLALNQWTHISVTRSGSTITLYKNGVSFTTATNTSNFDSSTPTLIGNSTSASTTFFGYISGVRIIKGTAVAPNITQPATAVSGTSLLTCQSNRFIDNSTNAFAITVNGNTSVQPFSPFAPSAVYSASVNGGSGYFDGTGDYLSMTSGTSLGSGDFTISCWIYLNAAGDAEAPGVCSSYNYYTSGFNGNFVARLGTGNLWRSFDGQGSEVNISGTFTQPVKEWFYMAWVRSGSTVTAYRNGVSLGSVTDTKTFSDTANGVVIGASRANGGTPSQNINGYIADFRIVVGSAITTVPTAPLTAVSGTSLLCNFTNAGIFDNTGKNNLETVADAQIDTTTKKYGTGSMEFDGTGDSLKGVPSDFFKFSGDFTIEAWVYINSYSNPGILFDTRTGGNSASGTSFQVTNTGALTSFTSTTIFTGSAGDVPLTTWTHIAMVRSGSTITAYANGVSKATATASTNYSDGLCFIGTNSTGTVFWNGFIDDLRITKGVARYTANFTPPGGPFQNS